MPTKILRRAVLNIYVSSSVCKSFENSVKFANDLDVNLEISRFGTPEILDEHFGELLDKYSKILKNFKNKISLHGFFFDLNPSSRDKMIFEATVHRYNQSFKIANAIGAKTIVFHSGYNGLIKHPVYFENFMHDQIEFWSSYIKKFENEGITAVLENTYEADPSILTEIVDRVNSNSLKICIDTGHVNINSDIPVVEWIEKIDKRLYHMHLHNNFTISDEHKSILKGTIDFRQVFYKLEQLKLNPDLVFEIFTPEEAQESIEFAEQFKKCFCN